MKRLFAAAALCLMPLTAPAPVLAQANCGVLSEIVKQLSEKYSEELVLTLPSDQAMLHLYMGRRSWTIVAVRDGVDAAGQPVLMGCLAIAGKGDPGGRLGPALVKLIGERDA